MPEGEQTDAAVAQLERAFVAVDPVMTAVTADDLRKPSPCDKWDVGTVATHLMTGLSGRIAPDAELDAPADDVPRAWTAMRAAVATAIGEPGALDREVRGPGGTMPLRSLIQVLPIEVMLHGWDVARGIGRPTDFDPELAERLLESGRPLLERFGRGEAFGPEQPAPDGASAMDRLAAFYGRPITG